MLTPAQIITINNVSGYLAANEVEQGKLFSLYTDNRLPLMLYMEGKALSWGNANGQTSTIQAVANYVYTLDGKFGNIAQGIIAGGSGGTPITPVTPPVPAPYLIPFSSSDFTTATAYNNPEIVGKNIAVFWNDVSRYLYDPADYSLTSTGINIDIAGFDALTNNYHFFIFILD